MKIVIELTEDAYPENKIDMVIEQTESPVFNWITIGDKKYSVYVPDLQKLSKFFRT